MLRELPSASLAAWGNAWLSGHAGVDDAVDAVERLTGPNLIGTVSGIRLPFDTGVPLRTALAQLRGLGLSGFRLCLPVPGDPLGLVGAAALNEAAIEAREAVLLRLADRQIGMVPHEDRRGSSYTGVAWTPYPANDSVPQVPDLAEAEQRLRLAITEAADVLSRVDDVAGFGSSTYQALGRLDESGAAGLAPGYPPRAHRVAAQADRLAAVLRLAGPDEDRGLSAHQVQTRRSALRALDRAVRRARVAAHAAVSPG